MKKAFRKILRIGVVITSLLILAVLAAVLLVLFDKPLVRDILQAQLAKRAGITIHIGRLDYTLFPFRLTAQELELGRENDLQKLGLSCAWLEAKGDFWKIVRGQKPAIETIEAKGAVFRLEQKRPAEKPTDYEAIVSQTSAFLGWARRITAKESRLTVSLLSLEASLEDLDLTIAAGDGQNEIAFSIGRSDLDIKDKSGAFRLRSGLSASGTLHLASSLGFDAALAFDSPRIAAAGIEESPARVTIESTGRIDLTAKEVSVSQLKIVVPDLFDLEGIAKGGFGEGFFLETEATARFGKLENLAALLGPRLPSELRKTRIQGQAILSGKYGIRRSSQEITDSLEGSLAFENVELDHIYHGLPLHLRVSGRVQAAGPSQSPQFSADIRSSVGNVALGKLSVGKSEVHLTASRTKRIANITQFEAAVKGLSFDAGRGKRLAFDKATLRGKAGLNFNRGSMGLNSLEARLDASLRDLIIDVAEGKRLSFETAQLGGSAGLDIDRKILILNSLEARFPSLSPLLFSGRYGLGRTPAAEVRLQTRGLDLPSVRALAAPFIPARLAGWDLGGTADLLLEARRPSTSGLDWALSGAVTLSQANLNDPDFIVAGEGINPRLKFEGEYGTSKGLSFKSEFDISQGESLWKAVYVSWSKNPLQVTVSGRYHPGSGGLNDLAARFHMPTIGEVSLAGSAQTRPALSFDLNSDARLSLGPLYSLYSQAGVSGQRRMAIEGSMGAGLHLRKEGDDLSVTGKVALAHSNLELLATKTVLLDIDAEFPIHYESRKAGSDAPVGPFPAEGFLRIGEFRNPFLTLKPLAFRLRVGSNSLAIEPFAQELYGGRLELGPTTFRVDPKSGFLQGIGSLALHDLDISRLPIKSPQFKLTGKVQAEFPRLDISPKEIAVSGRGEANVFGGKVVLRDLIVSDPFTPGRSISLNIDLLNLDLKKLTDEVPFGEVTGIVRGEVRNLVISFRQPERFEFRIESVPRKGVPQTFSLKAVDDLTVLSSGEQASVGTSQFWMRFIRGFRYEKLGIVSTLRNDTFTLNGTIHEGGLEYLVKKPALFGINVINRMPEKLISFKEMTSRLRRVGQSEK